jgi:hypothetical protein
MRATDVLPSTIVPGQSSETPDHHYGIRDMADDVAQLLLWLDISAAHIVGQELHYNIWMMNLPK